MSVGIDKNDVIDASKLKLNISN